MINLDDESIEWDVLKPNQDKLSILTADRRYDGWLLPNKICAECGNHFLNKESSAGVI